MPSLYPMTDPARKCPICGNRRDTDHSPFCSSRCRDRDLARWFNDGYTVAGRPALPEEIEQELAHR